MELTFREGMHLRRALRDSLPSRSALAQVIFDQLKEDLSPIADAETYDEVLIKLIFWAESAKRTPELIRGVRSAVPSNEWLREFEDQYWAQRPDHHNASHLTEPIHTLELRLDLVRELLRIPGVDSYNFRSTFLIGIPGALTRDQHSAQADLNTILDQLDRLGRLTSGHYPLLLVLDNAISYVIGYELETVLKGLRERLAQKYTER
jgi:hypothetical protein